MAVCGAFNECLTEPSGQRQKSPRASHRRFRMAASNGFEQSMKRRKKGLAEDVERHLNYGANGTCPSRRLPALTTAEAPSLCPTQPAMTGLFLSSNPSPTATPIFPAPKAQFTSSGPRLDPNSTMDEMEMRLISQLSHMNTVQIKLSKFVRTPTRADHSAPQNRTL